MMSEIILFIGLVVPIFSFWLFVAFVYPKISKRKSTFKYNKARAGEFLIKKIDLYIIVSGFVLAAIGAACAAVFFSYIPSIIASLLMFIASGMIAYPIITGD